MAEFVERVYAVVARIPRGKVMTYKSVAQAAGSPRAYRAVGMAMKRNPNTSTVPCHRVVASDGSLTGYSLDGGIATKRDRLLKEGVSFVKDKVDLAVNQIEPIKDDLDNKKDYTVTHRSSHI